MGTKKEYGILSNRWIKYCQLDALNLLTINVNQISTRRHYR